MESKEHPYDDLSKEELEEVVDDMMAEYWIDYFKSNPE